MRFAVALFAGLLLSHPALAATLDLLDDPARGAGAALEIPGGKRCLICDPVMPLPGGPSAQGQPGLIFPLPGAVGGGRPAADSPVPDRLGPDQPGPVPFGQDTSGSGPVDAEDRPDDGWTAPLPVPKP